MPSTTVRAPVAARLTASAIAAYRARCRKLVAPPWRE
jgi:hypothetical protein